ncbi:uncharacterized protein VP01_2921g3, partial [Puccinia sorghi]
SAVQQGLVALGDAGEMATRIILIRAMQQTTPIAPSQTNPIMVPHGYSAGYFSITLAGLVTRPTQPILWSFCTEVLRSNVSVGKKGLTICLPSISTRNPHLES